MRVGKEQEQVRQVKEAGLYVAGMRRAAVDVRIPQGPRAIPQACGCEAIGRKQERDKVAAVGRHPVLPGCDPPEEPERRKRQDAQRSDVEVPGRPQTAAAEQLRGEHENGEPEKGQ